MSWLAIRIPPHRRRRGLVRLAALEPLVEIGDGAAEVAADVAQLAGAEDQHCQYEQHDPVRETLQSGHVADSCHGWGRGCAGESTACGWLDRPSRGVGAARHCSVP